MTWLSFAEIERLSQADLTAIVRRFRAPRLGFRGDGPLDGDTDLRALLHRVATFARALGLPVGNLFGILDLVSRDAAIRRPDQSDLLIGAGPGPADAYRLSILGADDFTQLGLLAAAGGPTPDGFTVSRSGEGPRTCPATTREAGGRATSPGDE